MPPTYTLAVGRASPTTAPSPQMLAPVATSTSAVDFGLLRMFHAPNNNVYIYDVNDPSTPGCSGWAIPDTAVVPSLPPKQLVASGFSVGIVDLRDNMQEQDFSGQFTSGYKYFAGTVPFSSLSTWTTGSLMALRPPKNPFQAPVPFGPANWFGDDIMLLGPGLRNGVTDAGPAPGLNLLWVHSSGAVRADQSGMTEILTDRSNFVMAAAVPARIAATSASWDIVWVEDLTSDGGGAHRVMRMNELECQ
jgi:hypothetical protein